MNAIVPQSQFGAVSTRFAGRPVENDLGAGVQGGFGHIGYKGKVWSIRYRGEDRPLLREDGDGPRNSIEVVVVRAPKVISKVFYEKGYEEGSTAAPDCWSTNGIIPDAGAVKKQSPACVNCPKAAWGSKVTAAGKQGKACQDSKRLAIVPLADLANELFGGPMLLRVPAASLSDLAMFGGKMQQMGYPYNSYAVRIAFDVNESFPKFVFSAVRPLTDPEADVVLKWQDSPEAVRILAEGDVGAAQAAIAAPTTSTFEHPAAPAVVQNTPAPVQTAPVQTAPQPEKQSVTVLQHAASSGGGFGPVGTVAHTTAQPSPTTSQPVQPQVQPQPQPASQTQPSPAAATGVVDFDAQLEALLK